jgi:hypothetical protein
LSFGHILPHGLGVAMSWETGGFEEKAYFLKIVHDTAL